MKPIRSLATLMTAGAIATAAADTVHMKDNSTFNAKLLREDAATYTFEVQAGPGIKEERIVKKGDVALVDKERADDKAFVAIAALVPAPDLLTLADYQSRLKKANDFIQGNPGSPLLPKAKKVAGELERENDLIEAGGIKLNGTVVTAAERQANKFEIDGRMVEAAIHNQVAARNLTGALRQFQTFEKDYSTSESFRTLLPFMHQVMAQYRTEAAAMAASFDKRMKDRQSGIERMSGDEKSATIQAINEETAVGQKRFDEEKKSGVKWVTPNPDIKASLDEAVRFADAESRRLDTLKVDSLPDGGKAWRDAWMAVHAGADQKTASVALNSARTAKLPAEYLSELENASKGAGPQK